MTAVIAVKQGSTLRRVLLFRNAKTQVATDLTGQLISCKVRDRSRELVAEVDVTVLDQSLNTGKVLFDFGDTSAWPVGNLRFDIRREFTDSTGDVVVISSTAYITVTRSETDD